MTNSSETRAAPGIIVVAGASGGIGQAMVRALLARFDGARIHASHFSSEPPCELERVSWQRVDLRDEESIRSWAAAVDEVDWVVNCAGFLHDEYGGPEKSIASVESERLLESIRVNTLPSLLLARYFGAALKRSPAALLAAVSARVGSIEDNRLGGWYSYRASKAALNMALKTLSIEWRHSHPRGVVAALHPGTNDTALSRPFQRNLPAGQLLQPSDSAVLMTGLLAELDPSLSGRFWAWDGEPLPW